ncbi:MAG: hypothetical protein JNL60_05055 [Bacteroidia bacterium]|nr:hypothetical protein [Bacteroidia bacterium]
MKKKTNKASDNTQNKKKSNLNWKNKRELISKSIALEVDLQNRQIFFDSDISQKLHFDFATNNVDQLINTYLDPEDSEEVIKLLTEAERGLEKPIPFHFIHPVTSRAFKFEYRYQIIYVKYASTRLQGELVRT